MVSFSRLAGTTRVTPPHSRRSPATGRRQLISCNRLRILIDGNFPKANRPKYNIVEVRKARSSTVAAKRLANT